MIGASFLSRIKYPFLNKLNYLLVKKLFPLKKKPVFLIENKTIGIKTPKLFQLNLSSIIKEDISDNYCIDNPEIFDFSLNGELKSEIIDENLLEYFVQIPQIYYFDMNLEKPARKGKLYTEEKVGQFKENTLFDDKEKFEKCIHGTIKSWCSICREQKYKEEKERQLHFKTFSIFDLIFPILQPPLGDNLDNTIVMPNGKSLYNFQVFGVKFLFENNRALLGDEMGLGKSIQAIMALRLLFRQAALRYGLIICPKSVLIDWEKKIKEWAPELRILRVHGPKEYRKLLWQAPAHIHLATYDILRIDIAEFYDRSGINEAGQQKKYDFAVLDEIQRIKNPAAKINRAVKKIDTPIRWGLSGTPLENKAEELISIFSYLVPGLLRYEDAYKQSYIKDKIKPFFLRRRLKDALPELPEKIQEEIWLDLTENQKEAYDRAEKKGWCN